MAKTSILTNNRTRAAKVILQQNLHKKSIFEARSPWMARHHPHAPLCKVPTTIRPLPTPHSSTDLSHLLAERVTFPSSILLSILGFQIVHLLSEKMAPKGPYTLCTVNTAPERAKRLIGRVVEDVKEEYTIDYLQNAESERILL